MEVDPELCISRITPQKRDNLINGLLFAAQLKEQLSPLSEDGYNPRCLLYFFAVCSLSIVVHDFLKELQAMLDVGRGLGAIAVVAEVDVGLGEEV